MNTRTNARKLFCAAALLLGGCSVIGLDDFERCDEFGDTVGEQEAGCAQALNADYDLPGACRPWRCIDGLCVREDVEICDGADNDCDGVSDEGANPISDIVRADLIGGTPEHATIAAGDSSVRALWTDGEERGAVIQLRPEIGTAAAMDYARNATTSDGDHAVSVTTSEPGCWVVDRTGLANRGDANDGLVPSDGSCNFEQIEVGMGGDTGLVATISTNRCVQGALRVGHYDASTPGTVQNIGPAGRSNAFAGVSLTHDGECTASAPDECTAARTAFLDETRGCDACAGSERCVRGVCVPRTCSSNDHCPHAQICTGGSCGDQACTTNSDCMAGGALACVCGVCRSRPEIAAGHHCGVKDVALAAMPSARGDVDVEAIVAAVSGSPTFDCAFPDVASTTEDESLHDVLVWGAFLQNGASDTVRFVNVTGEGQARVLGQTTSTSAPATASVGSRFLVGHVEAEGLRINAFALPSPRAVNATMCEAGGVGDDADAQMCAGDGVQAPLCGQTSCGLSVGRCESGVFACEAGNVYCMGAVLPEAEVCGNMIDEDCDGGIDEEFCDEACTPTTGDETGGDLCNGIDDDCDGSVDESTDGDACGDPACGGAGRTECHAGRIICIGGLEVQDERCGNGLDDDCDGSTDEGSCMTCSETRDDCNGIDDDCDGTIDEDRPRQRNRPDSEPGNKEVLQQTEREPEQIRQCLATPDLTEPDGNAPIPMPMGQIEDMVMAVGPADRDGLSVGLAWRHISGTGQSIRFRRIDFNVDCTCREGGMCGEPGCEQILTPTGVRNATDTVRLTHEVPELGAPAVVYATEGVLTEGAERGGEIVLARNIGGWRVVFPVIPEEGGAEIFMRTATAHDGLPARQDCRDCFALRGETCNDGCAISLSQDSTTTARVVQAYQAGGRPHFAYLDSTNRVIVSGALSCPAR